MPRNYLRWLILQAVWPLIAWNCATAVAARVERGALTFENIPDATPGLAETLDGYLAARQATPLGWSPAGQVLIATRFGDVDQLHLVDAPGGARQQLTFLHEPISAAAFSPDPGRPGYVFLKDLGGNELTQLYYQRLGEPAAKLLTDGKSMNGAAVWSNSGREVAFFTTARDGVSYDIDIVDPAAGALPRLAVAGDATAWYPLDWSPDDRKLLVLKYVSISEGYLYVVDLATGQKKEVDPSPSKTGIAGAKFSRDGQGVYLISDRDGEFEKLRYVNLFTAEKTLLSDTIHWDIEELALSRDGQVLAYVSNEGGASKLNLVDLKAHQELLSPRLPAPGIIGHLCFDAAGKRLLFAYEAAGLPRDAYVLNLASNQVERWTHSETGPAGSAKYVTPRLTQFPTFDRVDGRTREEPVYVYEPSTPGPHPVLMVLHGGPESQFRPGFDPWFDYVVNELGFAVVAPNLRGSAGYGKTYLALDNGMLREDVVKDLGALIVWVDSQSAFDPKHVAVAGGSYGGYLALTALANYGDRLVGGVDSAGIADFITFLTNTAPSRQNLRRAEYGDERNPDMRAFLRRISPLTNAERITKPLLVVHGKNDPRVPLSEAQQIVNRLRGRGGVVWYLQADNEGHGLRKKANRDAYYQTFAEFIKALR